MVRFRLKGNATLKLTLPYFKDNNLQTTEMSEFLKIGQQIA